MNVITLFNKIVRKIRIEANFLRKRLDNTIVTHETINKNFIRQFLPPNPVIIDAGAHVGGDSIEICRLYKGATVHAFEPVPPIFKLLKHNTRKFNHIHCHALALSNQNGEQTMHVSSGASDGSSSLLKPDVHRTDHPDVFFNETINVTTKTLDAWATEQNIHQIDMLWLDMQGHELEVLKASHVILPTVKVVHLEVSMRSTYENVPLYDEVKAWMISKGFKVEVEAIPQGWDMGNVLFVRS